MHLFIHPLVTFSLTYSIANMGSNSSSPNQCAAGCAEAAQGPAMSPGGPHHGGNSLLLPLPPAYVHTSGWSSNCSAPVIGKEQHCQKVVPLQ